MTKLLDIVPSWMWAIAVAVLLALLGAQTVRLAGEKADHANSKAAFADERTKAADAARKAEAEQRAEEARREQEKTHAIAQAKERAASAQEDARRAGAAADSLRSQLAAFVARARGAGADSTAAAGSPPAGTALDLLADLFSRADREAGELAEYADRARIAGQTCERLYHALTPKP